MKPTTHKFVAVLNKKTPTGKVMNALAHMTAGLVASYLNLKDMRFNNYVDKDREDHGSISDNPFIILRADNSSKLRALRRTLIEKGIHFTDFTETMTVGTFIEQHSKMALTPEKDLEYYGVCFFAPKDEAANLTKKFSLWRD